MMHDLWKVSISVSQRQEKSMMVFLLMGTKSFVSVGHFLRAHCVLRPEDGSVIHRGAKEVPILWRYLGRDEKFSTADSSERSHLFQHRGQHSSASRDPQCWTAGGGNDVILSMNSI